MGEIERNRSAKIGRMEGRGKKKNSERKTCLRETVENVLEYAESEGERRD
jgi:hypothetical protein